MCWAIGGVAGGELGWIGGWVWALAGRVVEGLVEVLGWGAGGAGGRKGEILFHSVGPGFYVLC